eukprot:scaffold3.g6659.t1
MLASLAPPRVLSRGPAEQRHGLGQACSSHRSRPAARWQQPRPPAAAASAEPHAPSAAAAAAAAQQQQQHREQRSESEQLQYYATCHPGLEEAVAAELAATPIRAFDVRPGKAGVSFSGDLGVGYQVPLDAGVAGGDAAYDAVRAAADWAALLPPPHSFSVDCRAWSCTHLTSSQLLQARGRGGAAGARSVRSVRAGKRQRRGALAPRPARPGPPALLGTCTDARAPSARPRSFWPFTRWRDFDAAAWEAALEEAGDLRRPPPPGLHLWGNDVHAGALSLALRDAAAAGVRRAVRLHRGDARGWRLPHRPDLVVCNPPWGARLMGDEEGGSGGGGAAGPSPGSASERSELEATWFGLSEQCGGARAALLCGNPAASQALRLKAMAKHPLTIGGVECRVLVYGIRGRKAEVPPAAPAPAPAPP